MSDQNDVQETPAGQDATQPVSETSEQHAGENPGATEDPEPAAAAETDETEKPVWNVETHGPLPESKQGQYRVVDR